MFCVRGRWMPRTWLASMVRVELGPNPCSNPIAALRAYVVPVFLVFPIAFTLNRLGQHYDIDPTSGAMFSKRL